MKVDVLIPTLGRKDKLLRAVASLIVARGEAKNHDIKIKLFFSDVRERQYFDVEFKTAEYIGCYDFPDYSAPKFWNTYLAGMKSDALCYLTDDIEMEPACLLQAISCMEENFPDTDGLIGLCITNFPASQIVRAAFGLLGRKFTNRFPGNQAFCPEYKRFCIDRELCDFATEMHRFVYCEDARLKHWHPAWSKEAEDATHHLVRTHRDSDLHRSGLRKKRGFLWGRNFNLIGS